MKINSPFILIGIFLIITGILIIVFTRIPFFGNLPGDIHIKKEHFNLYIPITTSIIISIIITLILNIIFRK